MNDLFPHGRMLVCRPVYYDVTYEINPWMHVTEAPSISRAQAQWQALHHTLLRLGVWLDYVEPHEAQPDMVFTANAGLVRGDRCVVSRFRYAERAGEAPAFAEWFARHGFTTLELTTGSFEGEGDALFSGDTMFCGYGFRSDRECYEEIAAFLSVGKVVLCELQDPRFYHLDTCFCPLGDGRALIYPPAFTASSREAMRAAIEFVEVEERDAVGFACNSVILGRDVVMPAHCEGAGQKLTDLGYTVHSVELGEFIKAGGASKCLTLKL